MRSLSSRIFCLLAICIFCAGNISAQEFGGNSPKTKWRQINNPTVRVIFPKGLDTMANNISTIISRIAANNNSSLGNELKKVNIVLQNQTVNSNGYVGLSPFRSEFNTAPDADNFDLGTLSTYLQLSLHEYRHVQQYNNFNHGLSAVVKYLFGEDAYSLAINAAVPNWFFEGDAVYQETLFSTQGRGRLPNFLKAYPALWASAKGYSWMKLRNGSLKDYVPNHYDLGYLLVNYGTKKYGYDFWRKVTHDASVYKGIFYPMQKAVKRYAGINYKTFTNDAIDYYKSLYGLQNKLPDSLINANNVFPVQPKKLTSYYYPFQVAENKLLYLKSSADKVPTFYLKDSTGVHFIRYKDISMDGQYSYRNGKIVYAAYETNPRWQWENYSVLKILDIKTGTQRTLAHQTKYFSPDVSEDGKWIVANKVNANSSSTLVLINSGNGDVIKEIKKDGVTYFSNPKIVDDSTVVAVLRNKDASTNIAQINIATGIIKNITPPSQTIVGQIDAKKDSIFFIASQHLKDEIFCYDLKTNILQKLNTVGVGDYYVQSDFGKLNWSNFTADGYQLKQMNLKDAQWMPVNMDSFLMSKTGIVASTSANIVYEDSIYKQLSAKPYKKLTHPFNFHSWRPNYTDPEFSFTIYGNNVLNTVQTQLYYLYNQNDKTHATGGSLTYGGIFPYINLGSEYIFNRQAYASKKLKQWNEWDNYIGLSVPLSWVSGRTYKSFSIASTYYYRSDFNTGATKNNFKELRFSYLAHGIYWAQQTQMAAKNIYPRLGFNINMQFRHALNLYNSWQGYGALNIMLPGITPSQSLVLSGVGQYAGSSDRIFSNRVPYARGYAASDSAGVYSVRTNYHFALFYPDWGFANIFYLQRVRGNAFYDFTRSINKNNTSGSSIQSTGVEFYFDTKWWNEYAITLGFRIGATLTPTPYSNRKLFFEFLLPTNLIPR